MIDFKKYIKAFLQCMGSLLFAALPVIVWLTKKMITKVTGFWKATMEAIQILLFTKEK